MSLFPGSVVLVLIVILLGCGFVLLMINQVVRHMENPTPRATLCPSCEHRNSRHRLTCKRCGQPLRVVEKPVRLP